MYHHAQLHADRYHRRWNISSRTGRKIERIATHLISDATHTSVAFVDNDAPLKKQTLHNTRSSYTMSTYALCKKKDWYY